ncbi:MAG: general secretion pathway protein GspB [bacterium]|nr:general secretion pathway protein GspB [bacterium]
MRKLYVTRIASGFFLMFIFCGSEFARAAEELIDPTRPPLYSAKPGYDEIEDSDALFLSAILISEERRIAIINGKVVRKGDLIAGSRILTIGPWGVTLDGVDGQPLELRLSRRIMMSAGPPPEKP